jgi:hypothetical protein
LVPLQLGNLTFGFIASDPIALLDLPDELIALSFYDLPIIGCQAAHFSLAFPTSWFQFPLI